MKMDRDRIAYVLPVALALAAALVLQTAVVAQDDAPAAKEAPAAPLPPAEKVIERYVEALGGAAAVREPESLEMIGEFTVPAAGLNGTLRIRTMAPNKILTEVDIPGLGQIREGFDGEVGWSIDPTQGPRVKEGSELAQTRYQSDFYGALHEEERYQSMKTVDRVEFDGKDCYKLELVTSNGDEVTEYFDASSGLQAGTEMTVESPMGPMQVKQTVDGYREFGKLKLPTKTTISVGPMQQVLTFSDVKVDSVKEAVFDLPTEIRALVAE